MPNESYAGSLSPDDEQRIYEKRISLILSETLKRIEQIPFHPGKPILCALLKKDTPHTRNHNEHPLRHHIEE